MKRLLIPALVLFATALANAWPVGYNGAQHERRRSDGARGRVRGSSHDAPADAVTLHPAAGADFSFTLGGSANGLRCIQAVNFFLTASSAVATRTVSLRLSLGAPVANVGLLPEMSFVSPVDQIASQLIFYNWTSAIPQSRSIPGNAGAIPVISIPFPAEPVCAYSGTVVTVSSRTNNIQAADQITSVVIYWSRPPLPPGRQ